MFPNKDALDALFYEAETDALKLKELLEDPQKVLSHIGVAVPSSTKLDLQKFLKKNINAKATPTMSSKSWPTKRCVVCTTSAWAIAAGIVALGASAIALLSTASPIVVALAGWAGVAPAAALAFIKSLAISGSTGVATIANRICKWAGYCP